MKLRFAKIAVLFSVAGVFFSYQAPSGLSVTAWHLFGVFVALILGLILQPYPEPTLLMVITTLASIFVLPVREILSGYTDAMLWLTLIAMMIGVGLKKSGLTRRIGLILISRFGKTTLRIGYILSFIDLVLATSTPASPARTGGLVYPLAEGVIDASSISNPNGKQRTGAYFTLLGYTASMLTGGLFMTGMGPNLINAKLAQDVLGISISWPLWTLAALPGFIGFLLTPYIVYKLCPPDITSMLEVRARAGRELLEMGRISGNELTAAGIFLTILILWSTSTVTQVDSTLVAFVGISLMLVTGVLEWDDLAETKEMWSFLIWFGAILGFSAALTKLGFFSWFAGVIKLLLPTAGLGPYSILLLAAMLAVVPHYFFVSLTGYVVAFSPLVFSFVAATDVPRYPAFFVLAFLMVISCALTHYGNALGPLLMEKGYNDKKTWWSVGTIITLLHVVLYLTVGVFYWRLLGLWY
ncbi:DASS family sodium-coupled anion symporter [Sporomusa acidovorans]|uniref:Inner membrane protein YbhI n=1 Tax=Sporomusa acidovorans (strain ATCC 49682 / DSM 3132 / Mol) TaxID=1123286 RepID=A0ABZ3IYV2_SPOA4|nr:DASS family sodium-coupled anion symporter [Sporomusa acidovorans]OZC14170.1 inner membrane protein YbhI [Sporomusa acidovorans DSM 3132]SDE70292.1 divalent anion:Na+ symporter, DASS family [Sporomusa acidovorans]